MHKVKLIIYFISFFKCSVYFSLLDLSVSITTVIKSTATIVDLYISPCRSVICCWMCFETVASCLYVHYSYIILLIFPSTALDILLCLLCCFLHQFPFCQILRLLSQPILVRLPGISVSILLISWYIFFRVLIFNNSVFKIKCVFLGHGLLGLVFLPNVRVSLFSLISFTHLPLL